MLPSIAVISAVSAIILMVPSPQALTPGQAPASAPQPGTPGGGDIPGGILTPAKAAALALLPLGLTPVSVFPPFQFPAPFPGTVGVIFSENFNLNKRKKRWISRFLKAKKSPFLKSKPSVIKRIARGLERILKSFGKNLICFKSRFKQKFSRMVRKQTLYNLGYGIQPEQARWLICFRLVAPTFRLMYAFLR